MDLKWHIVHFLRLLATKHGIRVLPGRDWEPGANTHDNTSMHGIVVLYARGQVKSATRTIGRFQRLDKYTVTDNNDILQRINHAHNNRKLLTLYTFFAYIDSVIYIVIWTIVLSIILLVTLSSRKGRSWRRILLYSKKFKILCITAPIVIGALSAACLLVPSKKEPTPLGNEVFLEYSMNKVTDLLNHGDFILGKECFEKGVSPELVYILPTILKIYHQEVTKPTTPHLEQINDTLGIQFVGYKQFKNRSIRILKKVKKALGKRYMATITSKGDRHLLQVVYLGKPWEKEQLISLPVMEAAIQKGIDPALLMSLIRHVSDFQLNYEKDPKHKGLLALREGRGLEQIFIGADIIQKGMNDGTPLEETLVQFYPLNPPSSAPKDWRKDPMRHSWVEQVLGDIQFYRNNGLNLAIKENVPSKRRLPAILQPLVPIVGAQAASKIAELPPDSQALLLEELDNLPDDLEAEDDSTQALTNGTPLETLLPQADSTLNTLASTKENDSEDTVQTPKPQTARQAETPSANEEKHPQKTDSLTKGNTDNNAPVIVDLKNL